jgi:hypothetical protein
LISPDNIWSPQGQPFRWQLKWAIQKIRSSFDSAGVIDSAQSVYSTLSEIVGDCVHKNEMPFETTVRHIQALSGLSDKTIRVRLKDLERIGTIKIEPSPIKGPSKYTLLIADYSPVTVTGGPVAITGGPVNVKPSQLPSLKELEDTKNKNERISANADVFLPDGNQIYGIPFPEQLRTPAFQSAILEWIAYRRENRFPAWKSTTWRQNLQDWDRHSESEVIAVIKNSIKHGWRGIFFKKNVQTASVQDISAKRRKSESDRLSA